MAQREPTDVVLIVRPIQNIGPHPYRRLAQLLKAMKRSYGFRCVEIGPASAVAGDLELLDAMQDLLDAARESAKDAA